MGIRTSLPAFERCLPDQLWICFQVRSWRTPKKFFFFLPIRDGRPKYVSVPRHYVTTSKLVIWSFIAWLVFLRKNIFDFCMLIAYPKLFHKLLKSLWVSCFQFKWPDKKEKQSSTKGKCVKGGSPLHTRMSWMSPLASVFFRRVGNPFSQMIKR